MVQTRVEIPQQFDIRELSHSINNRMNAITLGMAVLEQSNNSDVRVIASAMKSELRDLERLINELKHSA